MTSAAHDAGRPTAAVDVRSLEAMDVAGRLPRLLAAMDAEGVSGLLVTSVTNLRYLSGVTLTAGMLLVRPEGTVLVTDGRYATAAGEQLAAAGVTLELEIASPAEQRAVVAGRSAGLQGLGLEAAHVSWARQRELATSWFPGLELVATVGLVEQLRRGKDPGELARMAAAAAIADQALAQVRPALAEGPTEAEFARLLDDAMRQGGASGPSFPTIVASGPNGAKPHHRAGSRVVARGETVIVDFGAVVDGYCSDMTRTLWVDELTSTEMARAVEVVTASEAAGVAAVAAGVAASAVDGACRQVIARSGWAELFIHGTGHGVGLDIHEAPSVAATSTDTLEAGHVVTVEPGVYLPGLGGVRVEDTVVVTVGSCYPLTRTPKDRAGASGA